MRRAHIRLQSTASIQSILESSACPFLSSVSAHSYAFPDVLPRRLYTLAHLSMFCYESGFENYVPRRAAPDGCNIDDPKTLNNLIRVSKFYEPNPKYLELIQENSFTIEMRKQLTEWMFEVCCWKLNVTFISCSISSSSWSNDFIRGNLLMLFASLTALLHLIVTTTIALSIVLCVTTLVTHSVRYSI